MLSPAGRVVFNEVMALPAEQLAALQKAQAHPDQPPIALIHAMRGGKLGVSPECQVPLPAFAAHVDRVNLAWWQMHLAGVAAMEPGVPYSALEVWQSKGAAFTTALKAEVVVEGEVAVRPVVAVRASCGVACLVATAPSVASCMQ
jgi:hypothetical protein